MEKRSPGSFAWAVSRSSVRREARTQSHPWIDDIKRKDFIAIADYEESLVHSARVSAANRGCLQDGGALDAISLRGDERALLRSR